VSVFRTTIPENPDDEPLLQLVTPEGTRVHHEELDAAVEHLTAEDLRRYYRDRVMVRAADLEATSLQRQGQLGLWASALGQEGAQIGAGHAARTQDYLVPTYREHGIAWARGIEPWRLLDAWRGNSHGGFDPYELRTHPYMIVLGAQVSHGVGYAMGLQRDGLVGTGDLENDTAVLTLFGDGTSSEGEVSEGFTFAASFGTPSVFFTQNNQWAISVPSTVQSRVPLAQRSRGWGIPSVRIDGNDVLASYAAVRLALDHARAGKGPLYIEAMTYRMAAHTTSDDDTRYRTDDELASWRRRDPITRLATYLRSLDQVDDAFIGHCEEEGKDLALRLHHQIHAMPDPDPVEMFDFVYAEPHPLIDEEREGFLRYQSQFEDEQADQDVQDQEAQR
jgi:pyruvate dehydrogenase E1 component alpha subunit